MEFAPVNDFPDGHPRSGLDIMLVCKRWLADQAYTHVIALFPAGEIIPTRKPHQTIRNDLPRLGAWGGLVHYPPNGSCLYAGFTTDF